VKPETVIAWQRRGFRWYWRWKSRRAKPGRPEVSQDIRDLIRTMSLANPLWGAPRIHGELLKLGIEVCQASVAKYMARQRKPPSQTWRSFLNNHKQQLISMDFFVVPTATLRVLYVFIVLAHDRRRVLHFNVTAHPSSEWAAQQIVEALPWDRVPDSSCGIAMRFMGVIPGPASVGWASAKCSRRRGLRGKIRTRSASFALSGEVFGPRDRVQRLFSVAF
jgi:hypothetical protein